MPSTMKALSDKAPVIRQITLYGAFSGLAAGVNVGSRYLLSTGGLRFTWSVILAYGLGMIVNILLNRYYDFPRRSGRRCTKCALSWWSPGWGW